MKERNVTDCNGQKYITDEPRLHKTDWVSLTKEEVKSISKINMDIQDMIYFVEAKIKEKNT